MWLARKSTVLWNYHICLKNIFVTIFHFVQSFHGKYVIIKIRESFGWNLEEKIFEDEIKLKFDKHGVVYSILFRFLRSPICGLKSSFLSENQTNFR